MNDLINFDYETDGISMGKRKKKKQKTKKSKHKHIPIEGIVFYITDNKYCKCSNFFYCEICNKLMNTIFDWNRSFYDVSITNEEMLIQAGKIKKGLKVFCFRGTFKQYISLKDIMEECEFIGIS